MTDSTTTRTTLTIGIDLGDRKSHVCVLDADGQVIEESQIATKPTTAGARPDAPCVSPHTQPRILQASATRETATR